MKKRNRMPERIRPGAALLAAFTACAATPAFAQSYGTGSPALYDHEGKYLGNLNANRYDPNSVSNPHGRYGSPYSSDSINNPHSRYGSPYSRESVNNPYGRGLKFAPMAGLVRTMARVIRIVRTPSPGGATAPSALSPRERGLLGCRSAQAKSPSEIMERLEPPCPVEPEHDAPPRQSAREQP